MAKKVKRAAAGRKSGASAEYKAVIDDLVMGNRILYDQGVVDGYGHVSGRDPRNSCRASSANVTSPHPVTTKSASRQIRCWSTS